jgi:phosphohistidine phosphatase SixA
MTITKALVAAATLASVAFCGAGIANAAELKGDALMSALKSGGYVIYLRHAKSDKTQTDADPIAVADCKTQRNLSDAGRKQAQMIGSAFKTLGIAIDKVYSSPYCRAKDTASLAFSDSEQKVTSSLYYSMGLPKDAAAAAKDELSKMLAAMPKNGSNTMLVGHTSNIKEVAGVWPKKEGAGFVFQPDGKGGFKVVGSFDASELEKVGG